MPAGHLTKEQITYELFDIDPVEFYRQRFLSGRLDPLRDDLATQTTISFQKVQRLVKAIRRHVTQPQPKILEVGCGSGPIGARMKHRVPHCRLYGVDLSSDCIAMARHNGFDEAVACDVFKGLPYADESFDFVFTMDFWGHIEFARKDQIIAECQRVTKKGGFGWHGIEAGFFDYVNCNPKDPEDYIRKYVWTEGHVGVETLEENVARFSRWFTMVGAIPWPLRPFLDMDNVVPYKIFGAPFNAAIEPYDDREARMCGNMVMGYCNEYLLEGLIEALGPILTRDVLAGLGPAGAKFAEGFVQGGGFAMLTVQRPL